MAFYEENRDPILRFGDVLTGFISTATLLEKPLLDLALFNDGFKVDIRAPKYSVIVTPCCSIEAGTITLCPLAQIPGKLNLLKNPHYQVDPTQINMKQTADKSIPPDEWEKLEATKKSELYSKGASFVFLNLFIYEEHDYLQPYLSRQVETKYYVLDFSKSYRVKSSLITRADKPSAQVLINSKLLQLSIEARAQLRRKMVQYYARVPEEDII